MISSRLDDLLKLAIETLIKNKECLVAQFIIQNPELRADEIEFVEQRLNYETVYSVRKKLISE